jgi:ubiquinone/menaquinone biosynthesis C-methylase UbiE
LDVGGSTGDVTKALCEQFDYTGTVIDPSDKEIAIAQQQGLQTIDALFETWEPPTDAHYDLVVCSRTIDHFINLKASLLKIRNLCKSDGVVLIDIKDVDMVWARQGTVESALKLDHLYYLAAENAPYLLQSIGLKPFFSDISSAYDRVVYLCRVVEPQEIPYAKLATWITNRTRRILYSRDFTQYLRSNPQALRYRVWRSLHKIRKRILRRQ